MCIICAVKSVMNIKPGKELKREAIGIIEPDLYVNLERAKLELELINDQRKLDLWFYKQIAIDEEEIKKSLSDDYEIRYNNVCDDISKSQEAIMEAVGLEADAWKKDDVHFEIEKSTLTVYKRYYVDIVEAQS